MHEVYSTWAWSVGIVVGFFLVLFFLINAKLALLFYVLIMPVITAVDGCGRNDTRLIGDRRTWWWASGDHTARRAMVSSQIRYHQPEGARSLGFHLTLADHGNKHGGKP